VSGNVAHIKVSIELGPTSGIEDVPGIVHPKYFDVEVIEASFTKYWTLYANVTAGVRYHGIQIWFSVSIDLDRIGGGVDLYCEQAIRGLEKIGQ